MENKLKSLSYDELFEIAKLNKKSHLFVALLYKEKNAYEIALELGLDAEYKENEMKFRQIVKNDTKKAAKLLTDFNDFLFMHICFPDEMPARTVDD